MLRLKSLAPENTGSGINLTPMLDVVFLILIFFLLTSIVTKKPVLNLVLPEANQSKMASKNTHLSLIIQKNGEILVDKKNVSPSELEDILSRTQALAPDKKLLISADKAAPFGIFVQVLDIAQKLKMGNLEILTTPEQKP